MSARRVIRYLAAVSAAACLACGDPTGLTSPTSQKPSAPTSNVNATYSRYILISGAWVCVDGCDNDRDNSSAQDYPTEGGLPSVLPQLSY
jgi:hypothetical protein